MSFGSALRLSGAKPRRRVSVPGLSVAAVIRPQDTTLEQGQLNWITNYIWGIADDVLRDLYVRGKYRDVITSRLVDEAPPLP